MAVDMRTGHYADVGHDNLMAQIPRERDVLRGESIRSRCNGSSDRSFTVDPLSYFSFQLMLHDWCNKGRGVWDGAYKRTLAVNRKE